MKRQELVAGSKPARSFRKRDSGGVEGVVSRRQ